MAISFKNYNLFLDRDGVINKRLEGEYVLHWNQFSFLDGVKDAIKLASEIFNHIVIVTNQQGIGKGLMTEEDLSELHNHLRQEIVFAGGRIDAIYHSPHLATAHNFSRKPNIGMALQAKHQFPDIVFSRSVMVGDSLSDMKFGKRAGMKTVFIGNDLHTVRQNAHLIDLYYPSLFLFISQIKS